MSTNLPEPTTIATGPYRLDKIATLPGHTDRVWYCAWSPGGTALATCGSDKTIRVWKKASKIQPVNPEDADKLPQSAGTVYPQGVRDNLLRDTVNNALVEVPFNKEQTHIDEDGMVLVNKNDWELMQVLEGCHTRSVRALSWSPSGRHLAAASFDHSVSIWELIDGMFELTATLRGHESEVKSVDWNSSGELLVTSSRDKTVWIWENDGADGWECSSVLTGHNGDIKKVAFHPFSDDVISASYDDTVRVWQAHDDDWYNAVTLADSTSTVWDYSLTSNGKIMTTVGDDKHLRIYAFDETRPLPRQWRIMLEEPIAERPIFAVTTSKPFFIPSYNTKTIPTDDVITKEYTIYQDVQKDEYYVGLAPNTGFIATADGDNDINIFELLRKIPKEQLATFDAGDISKAVQINANSPSQIINLRPTAALLNKGKPAEGHQVDEDEDETNKNEHAMPSQPDFTKHITDPLYTHFDGAIRVVAIKNAHGNDINKICWNPKLSNILSTAGDDNQVHIWRFTRQ